MFCDFLVYETTLGLVFTNSILLNESPKRFAALAISFSIFISILATYSSTRTSALYLFLEILLSINGSLKASTCPEAFHVVGCIKIAASIPTMFSCN